MTFKEKTSLKKVIEADLTMNLMPVKHLVKRWFLRAGIKFLKDRKLSDGEEKFLEDFTDFCLDDVDNLGHSTLEQEVEKV